MEERASLFGLAAHLPYPMPRESTSGFSQASVKLWLTLKSRKARGLPSMPFSPSASSAGGWPFSAPDAYSDRGVRPEEAPKPSTSASVPSSLDSLAFTSHSRA